MQTLTKKRALLGGVGGLLVAGAAPVAKADLEHGWHSPVRGENPDAGLIALCRQHILNLQAFNALGELGNAIDPLWLAYLGTKDAIGDAEPQTLAGMVAKAWAAKAEAETPDGDEDPSGGPAEDWAWDLVNDLLRISGEA